jgi:hypothetical protein
MAEMIQKNAFLELIHTSRHELDSLLAGFTHQQLEVPGVLGNWSIKDLISHIAWYEAEMVTMLKEHSLDGSKWWELSLEARNSAIFESTWNEPLETVLDGETRVYQSLVSLLVTIDEEDLNDPKAFAGMPSDWQPWNVIGSNTYEHYQDHCNQMTNSMKILVKEPGYQIDAG